MDEITMLAPDAFPTLLKEIPDPPRSLYMRGRLPDERIKLIAVVGSRRMSRYGKEVCEHLVRGLAGRPVGIVSGLALGIDGVAHRAALDAGLYTLAIPGSGLGDSVLYPASHRALARDILKVGGALLSEEAPDFHARPESFPKRNRIMAGMSHATLVIEATEKSGTLITAKLAVEYNRDLLCVPHPVFSEGGAGGHIFMKLGAAPARGAEDILEALGLDTAEPGAGASPAPALLAEERHILDLLSEPLHRDELIRALNMPTSEANALLLKMELKELVKESFGEIRKSII
ncbi:MAG: DNA-processing protein DprA [Candidatus Paceibacteria bacterium]